MKEVILTPFAPILVESTRSIGYSFEAALSDVIDNSIGKGAKNVNINFRSIEYPYIAIIDDACGMDESELELAMRFGSRSSLDARDANDLGRFGLGLKLASLSQCRKVTVVTKKDGCINGARWDLDHVIEKRDWVLLRLENAEIDATPHIDILREQTCGTIVIWEDFDRLLSETADPQKVFDEKIDIARSHTALVFHRFLEGFNPIKMFFNNSRIEPIDPFLEKNAATQPLIEQELVIDNSVIKVKPFILPYVSKLSSKDRQMIGGTDLRQNQGFYVYRNKRLIVWGTWFRLIRQYELNKLARVRVDIPNTLDSIWEIDIKKSTASLPDIVKRSLVSIVENTVGRSERVYKYRGRNINNDDLIHVWNHVDNRGSLQYLVNRDLPLYKALEETLEDRQLNALDSLIKTVEDSFPYGDVYYRVAKNENSTQAATLDFNEVHQLALDTIEYIKSTQGDIRSFLDKMDKYDCFMKYPDVIEAIRKEYKHE
jgi:hypothetical protein